MKLKQMDIEAAYFSMEIMMESDIPSYAGGLGILAGDLLRSCADMEVPAVGVSMVYSGVVYAQKIKEDGRQSFEEIDWRKMDQFTKLPHRITLRLKGEDVHVGCWRYDFVGLHGFVVPVYLLDTNVLENSEWACGISRNLYEDKWDYRFAQEAVLGIGGVKMLEEIGYHKIKTYHMNEGHSTMVSLALLEQFDYKDDEVRKNAVFTTHTPIPEGHDSFGYDMAHEIAETYIPWHIKDIATQESLSMSHLGMNMSKISLAVSRKHQKVTEHIFPGHKFDYVTNGVHHRTWIGHHQQDLYQKYLPGFLDEPEVLEDADRIPNNELWDAHIAAKRELVEYVNKHLTAYSAVCSIDYDENSDCFNEKTLTIAMARRPVPYKRPLLLYKDIERLLKLGSGKIQIIQCGRGHPADENAKKIIDEIIHLSRKLRGKVRIDYLENYSPKIARLLVAGCDVWLNTPMQPLEASGTSGMKAAMNGALNFSVPDGWWIEGHELQPDAGFVIGKEIDGLEAQFDNDADAESIYSQLEKDIIPLYYEDREGWITKMKAAIKLGAYFNTNRCINDYKLKAWSK